MRRGRPDGKRAHPRRFGIAGAHARRFGTAGALALLTWTASAAFAAPEAPAAAEDPELAAATSLSWSKDPTELARAEQMFTAYLAKHPDAAPARLRRGRVRAWMGNTTEAVSDYQAYLSTHPDEDAVTLELARTLSWSKKADERRASIPIFDRYLAKNPTDVDARLARARAHVWVGNITEADRDYVICIERRPTDDALLLERAQALFQGSTPGDAIPLFDRYIEKHPTELAARLARARALLWSGDYGRAEDELEALQRGQLTQAHHDEVDLELARLYAQTARKQTACDILEAILARSPANKDARAELERVSVPLHSRIEPSFSFYTDKANIAVLASSIEGRLALTRRFGILVNTTGYSLGTAAETLYAARTSLGAWGIYKSLEAEASIGPRFYEYFKPKFGASAKLRFTPVRDLRLEASYQYDDIYFDILQPASISAGIRGHALFATGDLRLPARIRITGRIGTRQLLPDNHGLDMSGTALVGLVGPLSVGYNVQFIAWTDNDPAYWSPQAFAAHLGIVRLSGMFDHAKFGYDAQAVLGAAGERIARTPDVGFGLSFGGSAALSYEVHPHLLLRLGLQYSQTVRSVPKIPVGGSSATVIEGEDVEIESRYWWLAGSASATVYF